MDKVVKYVVRLSSEERASLEALVKTGKGAADKRLRAQILLKADVGEGGPGWADADRRGVRGRSLDRASVAAAPRGRGVGRGPRPQAESAATAVEVGWRERGPTDRDRPCQGPRGPRRWTMQLLADRLVELKVVDRICDETVRRVLKKTRVAKVAGGTVAPTP